MQNKLIEGAVNDVLNAPNVPGHTMWSIVVDCWLGSNVTKTATLNIQSAKARAVPPSVPPPLHPSHNSSNNRPPPLPAPGTPVVFERNDSAMSGEGGVADGGTGNITLGVEADDYLSDLSVCLDAPVPVAIAHDVEWFDGKPHCEFDMNGNLPARDWQI